MTNSRRKGKRGELEVVHKLQEAGLMARRGQQYRGAPDAPDVICDSYPDLHIEVKLRETHNAWEWMSQAVKDMGPNQTPVVWMRKNKKPWLVVLRADDYLELMKGSNE